MRILLIDHQDSFTANLAHLIVAAGAPYPDVQPHRRPWPVLQLTDYDAVVLSPGPGHPAQAADLGVSERLLQHYQGPMLGVCLGFQAMALAAGGRVAPAPRPVHGRTSALRHRAEGLFAGLAQGMRVMRYHSHAVVAPGAGQSLTAWAEGDDVAMALEAAVRPRWGVQFHPESVGTVDGRRLMANFLRLAQAAQGVRGASRVRRPSALGAGWGGHVAHADAGHANTTPPNPAAPLSSSGKACPAAAPLRPFSRRLAPWAAPEAVFQRLYAHGGPAFWLDSARRGYGMGRWSFMGDANGPHGAVWCYRCGGGWRCVAGAATGVGARLPMAGDAFAGPRQALALLWQGHGTSDSTDPNADDAPPFRGGFVGALGYGVAVDGADAAPGVTAPSPSDQDDVWLVFADRGLAFDHARQAVWAWAWDSAEARAAHWLDALGATLADVAHARPPAPGSVAPPLVFHPLTPRPAYAKAIAAAQREIVAGESYEICLTTRFVARIDHAGGDAQGQAPSPDPLNQDNVPQPFDPWAAYQRLRRVSPAPYGAYLRLGRQKAMLCASPERFLRVTSDGVMEAKPIKGTAPRHADPLQDKAQARALRTQDKAQAENLMITDVLRNDLGRTAQPGSVTTPKLCAVERYAHVHQLVSTVRAQRAAGVAPMEVVRAAFPGGSMTGAPKARSMQIIAGLESGPRGWYSGAIGYVGIDGAVDLNIVIRTAVWSGGALSIGAGGAILEGSDPAAECDEVWLKARSVIAAMGDVDRSEQVWRADGDAGAAPPAPYAQGAQRGGAG